MARFLTLVAAIAMLITQSAFADPADVAPPKGARLLLRAAAQGVQIYTCTQQGSGAAWWLKGPEAVLRDDRGKVIGKHFAGPSWRTSDGSTVVGEVIAKADAPSSNAIPWLLLRAKSHSGDGRLAKVAFIQRIDTAGGVANVGCDFATRGNELRVPYSAAYLFFAAR